LEEDKRVDTSLEISGIGMKNPVMVCSGTFDNAREYEEWIRVRGAGILAKWRLSHGLQRRAGFRRRGA
jgi:dihydroorotate dehydrogenase